MPLTARLPAHSPGCLPPHITQRNDPEGRRKRCRLPRGDKGTPRGRQRPRRELLEAGPGLLWDPRGQG